MGNVKRTVITGKPVTTLIPSAAGGVRMETFIPWTLVKRGVRREVITPIEAPAEFREEARRAKLQQESEQYSPLLRALNSFWTMESSDRSRRLPQRRGWTWGE